MFTYLKLNNFQSLVDFVVDFMKNQKKSINLALIYGKNGVGKINLTNAFFRLQESFKNMKIDETVRKIAFEELDNINPNIYVEKLKKHYPDTRTIEKKYETYKEVYPLTVYKERTITNFNLRKRYLFGLYGAVPYTKDFNFYDVLNIARGEIL